MTTRASRYVETTPELDRLYRAMTGRGACSGQASGEAADRWFHVERTSESDIRRAAMEELAKQACGGCPVRAECTRWAVATRQEFGIWGGMAEHELQASVRDAVRSERARRAAAVAEVIERGRAVPVRPVSTSAAVAEVA